VSAKIVLPMLHGQLRVDGEQPDGVVWPLPPEVDLSLRMLGQLLTSSLYGALMTDFITGRLPQSALPQLQFPSGKLLASTNAAFGGVQAMCPWYPRNFHHQQSITSA